MKKISNLFIAFNLLLLYIGTAGASSEDREEAKKALASLEAYNKWAIETKKEPQIEPGKIEKIEKIEIKANDALSLLNSPKHKKGVIAKVISALLELSQTDIAKGQIENDKILEKVKWNEKNGEDIVLKDIESKEKIVKEWDWDYKDLVDILKYLPFEWLKEEENGKSQSPSVLQ